MRILLADRQSRVRSALRLLLEQRDDTFAISEAENGAAVLAEVRRGCPDLLLLDWDLPGLSRADLIAALKRQCPCLAVIVLDSQPQRREAALCAGADGFVSKNDPPETLLAAIEAARAGGLIQIERNIQGGEQ
jgi:DNA-binding NarL/FixJ family response regulator